MKYGTIKDCPFCGNSWGPPQPETSIHGTVQFGCVNPRCGATTGWGETEGEALALWNKTLPMETRIAALEADAARDAARIAELEERIAGANKRSQFWKDNNDAAVKDAQDAEEKAEEWRQCAIAQAQLHADDMSSAEAKLSRYEALSAAATTTLLENLHLADGDNCTLKELRDAVLAVNPSALDAIEKEKFAERFKGRTGDMGDCDLIAGQDIEKEK